MDKVPTLEELRLRFRAWRLENSLTQRDVARLLPELTGYELSPAGVCQFETGWSHPRWELGRCILELMEKFRAPSEAPN